MARSQNGPGISGNDTEMAATFLPSGISDKSQLRPKLLSPSRSPLSRFRDPSSSDDPRPLPVAVTFLSEVHMKSSHPLPCRAVSAGQMAKDGGICGGGGACFPPAQSRDRLNDLDISPWRRSSVSLGIL
ncbi:unnamed protein product [Pleuronectes platessa]|uniref:Uncharacterized protein n=1 Tax=Pleuronectes platessa TaxID=8262 RepID=A0A9N7TJE9_PLEPL|nr:unnamed protein product [Pleuronectes platessa]